MEHHVSLLKNYKDLKEMGYDHYTIAMNVPMMKNLNIPQRKSTTSSQPYRSNKIKKDIDSPQDHDKDGNCVPHFFRANKSENYKEEEKKKWEIAWAKRINKKEIFIKINIGEKNKVVFHKCNSFPFIFHFHTTRY